VGAGTTPGGAAWGGKERKALALYIYKHLLTLGHGSPPIVPKNSSHKIHLHIWRVRTKNHAHETTVKNTALCFAGQIQTPLPQETNTSNLKYAVSCSPKFHAKTAKKATFTAFKHVTNCRTIFWFFKSSKTCSATGLECEKKPQIDNLNFVEQTAPTIKR